MVVIDILGQFLIFIGEAIFAVNLDIFFILIDEGVSEEEGGLVILGFIESWYLFISYEFGIFLFVLLEILGIVALDRSYFLYCVYFTELIYVLESCFITHFLIYYY